MPNLSAGLTLPGRRVDWIPPDKEHLQLWVDANRGITMDGSNRISQWDDLSQAGNDLTQTDGAMQPLYYADYNNKGPAVYFDSTRQDQLAKSIGATQWTEMLMAAVVEYADHTTYKQFLVLWHPSYGADDAAYFFCNTSDQGFFYSHPGSTYYSNTGIGAIVVNETQRWLGRIWASGKTQYMDVQIEENDWNHPTYSGPSPIAIHMGYRLGYNGETSTAKRTFDGVIRELLIYNAALTDDQITEIYDHLGDKWNVTRGK